MAMQMTVQGNLGDAAKLFKDMPKLQAKAMALALNRVATQAQTAGTKVMRERYAFPAKLIRGTFRIQRATPAQQTAGIISKGPRIQLINMTARQTKKGVTVRIGQSRKLLRGTFIARMKSGHIGVFERTGSARLPIKELFTLAVPEAFVSEKVRLAMEAKTREALLPRYQHELDRLCQAQASNIVKVTSQ